MVPMEKMRGGIADDTKFYIGFANVSGGDRAPDFIISWNPHPNTSAAHKLPTDFLGALTELAVVNRNSPSDLRLHVSELIKALTQKELISFFGKDLVESSEPQLRAALELASLEFASRLTTSRGVLELMNSGKGMFSTIGLDSKYSVSKGNQVLLVQLLYNNLVAEGYFSRMKKGDGEDLDPQNLLKPVKNNYLEMDGVVGRQTRNALYNMRVLAYNYYDNLDELTTPKNREVEYSFTFNSMISLQEMVEHESGFRGAVPKPVARPVPAQEIDQLMPERARSESVRLKEQINEANRNLSHVETRIELLIKSGIIGREFAARLQETVDAAAMASETLRSENSPEDVANLLDESRRLRVEADALNAYYVLEVQGEAVAGRHGPGNTYLKNLKDNGLLQKYADALETQLRVETDPTIKWIYDKLLSVCKSELLTPKEFSRYLQSKQLVPEPVAPARPKEEEIDVPKAVALLVAETKLAIEVIDNNRLELASVKKGTIKDEFLQQLDDLDNEYLLLRTSLDLLLNKSARLTSKDQERVSELNAEIEQYKLKTEELYSRLISIKLSSAIYLLNESETYLTQMRDSIRSALPRQMEGYNFLVNEHRRLSFELVALNNQPDLAKLGGAFSEVQVLYGNAAALNSEIFENTLLAHQSALDAFKSTLDSIRIEDANSDGGRALAAELSSLKRRRRELNDELTRPGIQKAEFDKKMDALDADISAFANKAKPSEPKGAGVITKAGEVQTEQFRYSEDYKNKVKAIHDDMIAPIDLTDENIAGANRAIIRYLLETGYLKAPGDMKFSDLLPKEKTDVITNFSKGSSPLSEARVNSAITKWYEDNGGMVVQPGQGKSGGVVFDPAEKKRAVISRREDANSTITRCLDRISEFENAPLLLDSSTVEDLRVMKSEIGILKVKMNELTVSIQAQGTYNEARYNKDDAAIDEIINGRSGVNGYRGLDAIGTRLDEIDVQIGEQKKQLKPPEQKKASGKQQPPVQLPTRQKAAEIPKTPVELANERMGKLNALYQTQEAQVRALRDKVLSAGYSDPENLKEVQAYIHSEAGTGVSGAYAALNSIKPEDSEREVARKVQKATELLDKAETVTNNVSLVMMPAMIKAVDGLTAFRNISNQVSTSDKRAKLKDILPELDRIKATAGDSVDILIKLKYVGNEANARNIVDMRVKEINNAVTEFNDVKSGKKKPSSLPGAL